MFHLSILAPTAPFPPCVALDWPSPCIRVLKGHPVYWPFLSSLYSPSISLLLPMNVQKLTVQATSYLPPPHTQSLGSVIIRQPESGLHVHKRMMAARRLLFKNSTMHHVDIQTQHKFTKTNNPECELNRMRNPASFSSADVSQPILTHPDTLRAGKKRRPLGCGVKLGLRVAIIRMLAENGS